MSEPDTLHPRSQPSLGGALYAVDDDMTAIFGADRAEAPRARRISRQEAIRRPHRGLIGVAALALAGAAVTAGIMAGRSVPTAPQLARSPPSQPRPTGSVASRPPETPGEATATAAIEPPGNTRQRPAAGSRTDRFPDPSIGTPSVVAAVPLPAAPVQEAAPIASATPPPPLRVADLCDDDCLVARVQAADERLRDAFIDAQAAGVQRRTLRRLESTWDYARERASDSPREALRIYAGLTAGVRDLASERAGGGENQQ